MNASLPTSLATSKFLPTALSTTNTKDDYQLVFIVAVTMILTSKYSHCISCQDRPSEAMCEGDFLRTCS